MVCRAGCLAAALAAAACGGQVDLVAEGSEVQENGPAPFPNVTAPEPCVAGDYRGRFKASSGFLALEGKISVTLTRSPSGEFFTVDRNSTLGTPEDATGAAGPAVAARVVGDGDGSCSTGDFTAKLEGGEYRPVATEEAFVPFTGEVEGVYRFTPWGPILVGSWEAFLATSLPDEPISAGTWMAVLGDEDLAE